LVAWVGVPTTTSTTLTSTITITTAQCNIIYLSLYVVEWVAAISRVLIKKDACPKCRTTYSDRAAPLYFSENAYEPELGS